MILQEQNILFFSRTMGLGGTEKVVLQLCKILKPLVNSIVVCSCGGNNVDVLYKMGVKHYEIPDIERKSPKTMLSISKQLLHIIKQEKITVVHTHHRMATLYMKILHGITNIKIISTLHGEFYDNQIITRLVYKKINIIACGNVVKEKFARNFDINPSNIKVIHNAIEADDSNMIPIDELSIYKEKYTMVAYIGRLSPEKGIDVLIRAIAEVISKNRQVLFVFVGEGFDDYKRYILELINELGVRENIIFLGYRNDVQNVIKQVDFVVLPSNSEGLPLTLIEAFSQGKTVVATKAGGTVEIVTHEVNGLLVEIGNYQQLSNNILRLCNDEELRNELSKNALDTYQKEYSFEKFCEDTITYYEKLD